MSTMQEVSQAKPAFALPAWYLPVISAAAIVAAIASEVCTNANQKRFFTPEGLPPFPPELLREIMWNNIYNHSICFGFMGAVTCGLLVMITAGLAGPGRAMLGFVVGSLAGLLLGAAAGVAGYFITQALQPMNMESILMAMLIFAPLWGLLGLVTNVASVRLLGRSDLTSKAIQMCVLATLATVLIFPLVTTIVFPADWPGRIIQEHPRTRLVCYVIGVLGMVGSLYFTLKRPKSEVTQAEPQAEPAVS